MSNYRNGPGHVPSYQISSIPYATSSIAVAGSTVVEVEFYNMTRFITVRNEDSHPLRLGFSELGVQGTNFIELTAKGDSFSAEYRLGSIFLYAPGTATTASVIAGLTTIPVPPLWTNWTGSAGIG